MNGTVCVFYEGVLQTPRNQPILTGFLLVASLAQGNRVVLATSGSSERVDHQMRTEKLQDKIAEIVDSSLDLPPLPLWQRQIEVLRSRHPVTMVLTAEPFVAEWVLSKGMTSLFFAHPGFSRPAIRPVQGNRDWESLVQELEARA
jgi:hypothetical protein